jgi:hypothetical protein
MIARTTCGSSAVSRSLFRAWWARSDRPMTEMRELFRAWFSGFEMT